MCVCTPSPAAVDSWDAESGFDNFVSSAEPTALVRIRIAVRLHEIDR